MDKGELSKALFCIITDIYIIAPSSSLSFLLTLISCYNDALQICGLLVEMITTGIPCKQKCGCQGIKRSQVTSGLWSEEDNGQPWLTNPQ